MKYFIISGETSGDLHAAKLIQSLKKEDPEAIVYGIGSIRMKKAGAEILLDSSELNVMGFWQVILKIFTILRFFKATQKAILEKKPHAIVFIDFAGFNLKMAAWAKKKGFKTFYYISPKIWAWNTSRAKIIKKYIDKMFVILPFEVPFYQSFGIEVHYVGNPLLDRIERNADNKEKEDFILLLPGSRKAEISYLLPIMLQLPALLPDAHFIIGKAEDLPMKWMEENLYLHCPAECRQRVQLSAENSYSLMKRAKVAVVTSGTATLETALHYTPQVVCYKSDPLSIRIAKLLIKVPYISLVNLIANKEIVKELIQENCTAEKIKNELLPLLENGVIRKEAFQNYEKLWDIMGTQGASDKTATGILKHLNSPNP
jgi:lipid-A-disaccharide synthase